MKVDKDKPWTWVKYQEGLCRTCKGSCCSMPVEVKVSDLVRLGLASEDEKQGSLKKLAKRLLKEKRISSYRESSQLFMLSARPDGDCSFLDPRSRLCTVYEKRPDTCRQFPVQVGPRVGWCPYGKSK